jgi:hypothetical protein
MKQERKKMEDEGKKETKIEEEEKIKRGGREVD